MACAHVPRVTGADSSCSSTDSSCPPSSGFTCAVYDRNKIQFLREQETIPCDVLAHQPHIVFEDRSRAVALLLSLATKGAHLWAEQAFLALALLDRYLASATLAPARVPLATVTALWVASKVCDGWVWPLVDVVKQCPDAACSPAHVTRMEAELVSQLNYRLTAVTPFSFIHELGRQGGEEAVCNTAYALCFHAHATLPQAAHMPPSQLALGAWLAAAATHTRGKKRDTGATAAGSTSHRAPCACRSGSGSSETECGRCCGGRITSGEHDEFDGVDGVATSRLLAQFRYTAADASAASKLFTAAAEERY